MSSRTPDPKAVSQRHFPTPQWAYVVLLSLSILCLPAQAANIIHEFYTPMPEAQSRTALVSIEPASGIVGTTMESVISIVVTGNGTIVHYDEWEDGYEVDLNNPSQSTTKIWGDGNNANGIPPGYANDPASLTAGAVINLRNLVSLPRNPASILYDGRDRFGGTKALVVTRTGWATAPGTVLAGSVEVTATMDYGTQYISPVGQDVSAASMFEYVGLMVMARENGTSVTVDINGPATGGTTTFTLNQGESYLVNGGVLKGATVNASKPVQCQLITGDIGARYETDWFTLYPVDQWTGTYYSPVGTASDGDATFGFFYNPTSSSLTINVVTCLGTGSFVVPGYGVYQYQMPQNCGAKFTSVGNVPFFGIVTVGANPTANNVHDWGFTLVPSDSLTTEAVVGWGPGSGDLTSNGSPVWVTPVDAARIYVDYNGDLNGSLTDPKGNKYDVHYDLSALSTKLLFDPDKDQSAMRIYTLDGTLISAAWGQDPGTAGPGNPFLDVGTTVLPFPVPTLIKSFTVITDVAPTGLSPNDTLEYKIDVDNKGLLPLGNLLVLDPLNTNLVYVASSTKRDGVSISDNTTPNTAFPLDESGYTIPIILRGGTTSFTYRCTIKPGAVGSIANTASNSNYNLVSTAEVVVQPSGGSTACAAQFTNSSGVVQTSYSAGTAVYATMTDPDANNDTGVAETITVVTNNTSNGDAEFVTLTETGINTGTFRNITGIPTSTTSGTNQMDGTLLASPGNSLSFTYTDPEFNETCSGTATISVPTQNKYLYLDTDGTDGDTGGDLDRIDPVATGDGSMSSTSALSPGSTNPFYASSPNLSIPDNNTSGVSDTITVTGASTISDLDVALQINHGYVGDLIVTLTHVSTGTTVTLIDRPGRISNGTGCSGNNINATLDDSAASPVENECQGSVPTISGTFSPNGALSAFNGESMNGDWRINVSDRANQDVGTLVAWQLNSTQTGGSGSSTATFTQTPSFASTFTMPSGSTPTVSSYYTVSSGTMPASASITAALRKNGTAFATSTSASASGGLLTFTFGALSSAQTFATGDVMSLVVTTAQSGVTFTLDYDSTSKPSKITLPTTTVINIDSLAVYDAPYPGGNLVTGPASGTTVYIRGTVSDPFGAYDITSLGLDINGPGTAGDVTTTLTAPNVVDTATGTKTYEYPWSVGSTTGTYNISVTANEGTEGINATRATSVNVTFLDLGTPSITEFTTGPNGPGTPTYAGGEQVCVRVTDLDQNLSATTAETIQATITSLAGDSEVVTLLETGLDTGVFVFCIPASTGAPNTFNDGTLHAILGDVLTVTYVDPTDSTDTGTDTATIPNISPALTVNKTLITPTDGQAVIGEAISYQVQVINTGNTTLNGVTLVDTYPAAKLTFLNASTTPATIASGSLTWNIGTLNSGQSVTHTLNFTALGTAAPAVNTATATATGGTSGADTANVTITDPKISISKTLLSPNPGPANIGDNVTFRIQVTNTGDTAIANLPLEDTYSGADFEFVSATLSPDASGSGSLLWLDVTGAGNLAPSGTVSIDVVLKAKGSASPATNVVAANYTVDVNGDSAPPVTSSASITLLAAKISGHVYDDVNQNGAYNPPGDSILESITVSLYSDPNGDGNPADGVLVGITTTDANGAYEFLNLAAGDYVVVESQPPGYSSHSDTAGANDNRIPVDVVTLTTYAGNNFFDFQTPPVSYASIAGKVWNDANASATVNGGETGIENISVDLVEDTNNNGTADPGEAIVSSTLTAADGTYYFGGLSAGNYVVVEHDLFGWYSTADSTAPNNNQIRATLTAGQNATGKDFLDVLTGVVTGHVYRDINGNGTQDSGEPNLSGIDLLITRSDNTTFMVTTDSSGNWTATVPPGTTTANIDELDPDYPAGSIVRQGAGTTSIVAVSSASTGSTPVGLFIPGTISGFVRADTDNNDSGDSPLSGVTLTLKDSAGNDIDSDPGTAGIQPTTTTTIGDGSYSFDDLPPGTYRVVETDPSGYNSVSTNTVTPVTVTGGATTSGIDFVDEQPGTISGFVRADTDNNDSGDAPLSGVTLTLKDSAGNDIDSNASTAGIQPTTTTTAPDGSYSFSDLPPGTYRVVETDPPDFNSVTPNTVSPVVVDAGQTTSNINFVDEQTGDIRGIIFADTDNDGFGDLGLENVTLTLFTDPNGDGDPSDGVPVGVPTPSDGSGHYAFLDLAPGSYVVVQSAFPGYIPVFEGDTLVPKDEPDDSSTTNLRIPVTIVAAETDDGNNFIMEETATVGNHVWLDVDNDGIKDPGELGLSGVVVELIASDGSSIDSNPALPGVQPTVSTTDAGGVYSFNSVPPGSYRIRIATPPGTYPLSSANTDTTDNGEDNDDNGIQITPSAAVLSPVFTLAAGETDITMDFGFTSIAGSYSISGQVRDDYDLDGNFSDSDQPVGNVTVKLYADSNDNGIYDDGVDLLVGTTTTNGLGNYTFSNLPDGKYFVQEIDPRTASSTADTQGNNDNLILVTIAGASSVNNDFLDAVDPHGYIYTPVTGQLIPGGSINVSGPGTVTVILDGSSGQYSFITDGTPGIYTLTYSPPLGYIIDPSRPVTGTNFDPTGGPSPTVLGSAESTTSPGYLTNYSAVGNPYYLTFNLAAGDPLIINNNIPVVEMKPSTFAAWQYANPLGGSNGPTDDPDGDGFTNLEEFAFCFSPGTGVGHGCSLKLVPQPDGSVNATLRRLAQSTGLTYTVQSLTDLAASPAGWTDVSAIVPTVASNGDGTETATYTGVNSLFASTQGFLRVKVSDSGSGATVYTDPKGFTQRTFQIGCTTCSIPYTKCAAATGVIDSTSGSGLLCTTSAGSSSISAALTPGRQYYVEITDGDHEGHRLEVDEAATTATTIAIDLTSTLSTLNTLPATLAADHWKLVEHQTLGGLFPPSKFTATALSGTADRILMHQGNAFKIYWLWSNSGSPKWVDLSDINLIDAASTIISPCAGFFVHPKGSPVTLTFEGAVRTNDFVCPLPAGSTLVGGGWPIDQSPNQRAMTAASGFTGSRRPTQADKIMLWRGDVDPTYTGYNLNSYLTLATVNRWASENDATVTSLDNTALFKSMRAAFLKVQSAKPAYTMPLPWNP